MDEMLRKYRYFISYTCCYNGNFGSGNFQNERDDKIENIQQITSLARSYEEQMVYEEGSLVIMNYFIMKEQKEETIFDKIKNILRGKKH